MSDEEYTKGSDAYKIMQASIAQSVEQAVQDSVDSYQRISTIEETAIAVATARWITTKEPVYAEIIENANENMVKAIDRITLVGTACASVISDLKVD